MLLKKHLGVAFIKFISFIGEFLGIVLKINIH